MIPEPRTVRGLLVPRKPGSRLGKIDCFLRGHDPVVIWPHVYCRRCGRGVRTH